MSSSIASENALQTPAPLDLLARYHPTQPVAPTPFWLPGLSSGIVGGLIGDSTLGKSWISLLLMHDWALQTHLTQLPITQQGIAGYLSLEDGDAVLSLRLHALAPYLTSQHIARSNAMMRVWDWSGMPVGDWDTRIQQIESLATQVQILIIDHLRRLHGLDENSNNEMARVIGDLQYVAQKTHTTILTVHHTPTIIPRDRLSSPRMAFPADSSQTLRARGAGVIHNLWRWCAGLSPRHDGGFDFIVLQARTGIASRTVIGSFQRNGPEGMPRPYTLADPAPPGMMGNASPGTQDAPRFAVSKPRKTL
ncbi:MAG: hypothetical protein C7B46_19910 [Sulfobacillus benefaciens]|uniref:SF4 helicase domain-containing protein n=1 Tax=Sulfobacillus benefaciens TaxID=453960 RepID=A0A2T2WW89_9FIRM|nr:MAG: hypothetical protein C7B46_19910 [Sulfobacillus benefaciens]